MEPVGRDHEQDEDMFEMIRENDIERHEDNLDDFSGQFLNESGDGLEIDVSDSSALRRAHDDSTVGKSSAEVDICPQVFVSVDYICVYTYINYHFFLF